MQSGGPELLFLSVVILRLWRNIGSFILCSICEYYVKYCNGYFYEIVLLLNCHRLKIIHPLDILGMLHRARCYHILFCQSFQHDVSDPSCLWLDSLVILNINLVSCAILSREKPHLRLYSNLTHCFESVENCCWMFLSYLVVT